MEYVMSNREKRRQRSLVYQMIRFMILSLKFVKLTRLGACS